MTGIYAHVKTRTIFRDFDFYLEQGYALPGMTDGRGPLPSLIMGSKSKNNLVKANISLDR